MKMNICSIALATLTVACVLAASVVIAQGLRTAEEVHARAFDGYHLWSATYDREMSDLPTIQPEIGNAVAKILSSQ